MSIKTAFQHARQQKIDDLLSKFADTLTTQIAELEPLSGNLISLNLGDASKKEIRASNAFQLVKDACRQRNVKFTLAGSGYTDCNSYLQVNPRKTFVEANNLFERLILRQ